MKHITYIIAIAAVMSLASCADSFLDTTPSTTINENDTYKTDKDFMMAITSVYSEAQDKVVQGLLETLTLSDESHAGGGGPTDFAHLQRMEIYNVDAATTFGWWGRMYSSIYKTNVILEKLEGSHNATPELASRIKGEAHFMRSLFYYHLFQMYGEVVIIEKPLTVNEYYNQVRSPVEDVYKFMMDDIALAIELLPTTITANDLGRVSKDAAYVLKARIVLMANDDSKMDEIADDMKNIIDSRRYELANDFKAMWLKEGEFGKESIWEIAFSSESHWGTWDNMFGGEGNPLVIQIGYRVGGYAMGDLASGWGAANPTKWLAAQFDKAKDTRYEGSLVNVDAMYSWYPGFQDLINAAWYNYSGYAHWKYNPRVGYTSETGIPELNYENNHRAMRYGEVLLIAAEAIARGSRHNISLAQGYLDDLRKRAFKENFEQIVITKSNWRDVIIKERCLELALEGFRYWDLMRLDLGYQYLTSIGWRSHHRYMPIPQETIDNSFGSVKQNAGY